MQKKISDSTISRLSKYYRTLGRLIEQKVQTVSSDEIADIDPNVILELHDERIRKNQIDSELSYLREISGEQRQADKNKYDEEINELYRKTLSRRFGNNLSEEERLNALDELLEKYPDSYAAAKAVSSKAIESVFRNNIDYANLSLFNSSISLLMRFQLTFVWVTNQHLF